MNSTSVYAIYLICMMITSSFPIMYLLEAEGDQRSFEGGSGTEKDPYLVEDILDLQAIVDDLTANYALVNDIDAKETENLNDGAGFLPVGNEFNPFNGSFDGRGHTITGLSIDRGSTKFIGLFGYVLGGRIGNVVLSDVNITGYTFTGPLVGNLYSGAVDNCSASGTVRGTDYSGAGLVGWNSGSISNSSSHCTVTGYQYTGGLVGTNGGTIFNCYVTGEVAGSSHYVGGLAGSNLGNVSQSYATGTVSGDSRVGGLVGDNFLSIYDSFATGDVNGKQRVGGLVGLNNAGAIISNSYATGMVSGNKEFGGMAGVGGGRVESSYWDIYSTGQIDSSGGEGRTTVEMMQRATYFRWDFENVWTMVEGHTYPWLRSLPDLITPRILSPVHSGTIVKGDSLRFTGSMAPDSNYEYRWKFGSDRTTSLRSPGLVSFSAIGSHEVVYDFMENGEKTSDSDARTFEVIDDTLLHPDLHAINMEMPNTMAPGEPASIHYTAQNIGNDPVTDRSWQDAIYLSRDSHLDSGDILLESVGVTRDIAQGATYDGTISITFPLVEEGPYYLILSINDDWSFAERHRLNNELKMEVDIAILELEEDEFHIGEYSKGCVEQYFRLNIPSGRNLILTLEGAKGLELCLRHRHLPTRAIHDKRSDTGRLIMPSAYGGTWYVLVRKDRMSSSGSYSIKYITVSLILKDASPDRHVSSSPLEIMLTGTGFVDPIEVELVGTDGRAYKAGSVEVHLTTQLTARFAAGTLPKDTYTIRTARPDGGTAQISDALEVLGQGEANFEANLIMPGEIGYNSPATLYVEYENIGDLSMPAPLLSVTGTQGDMQGPFLTLDINKLKNGIWTSTEEAAGEIRVISPGISPSVQFLASGETPGMLHPGESRQVPVYYAGWEKPWNMDLPSVEWSLGMLSGDDDTLIDQEAMKGHMRADHIHEDAWEIIWSNFIDRTGETWGEYVRMIGGNALYLYRQGQRVEDVNQLLALSICMAEGWNPLSSLLSEPDIYEESPGIPISFKRNYMQPISRRFQVGSLGRGWTHNWQISLEVKQITVNVLDMTGSPRVFGPDKRYTGRFLAQPGDHGDLRSLPDGGHRLKEPDGTIKVFRNDGNLDHIEDTNGNRIILDYTDTLLTRISHSSGQFIEIEYNDDDRIIGVSDTYGRETIYSYDGEYLVSSRSSDGYTTDYEYETTSGSASQHALSSIRFPGEDAVLMDYDARGRLISMYREGEREKNEFTYGLGLVKLTDDQDNTAKFYFDHGGRITRFENPLGETTSYLMNDIGQLEQVTDPAGLALGYRYDRDGNVIEITDRMGQTTGLTYSRNLNRLTRIIDPKGSGNGYEYDQRGNMIEIYYVDGSRETWTHDDQGNPLTWTNRRGNTTEYSYDPAGRLIGKVHADDSGIVYEYDDRGNMIGMKDASGETNFTRDAYDRITGIDYPGGQWLEFTYDDARRRNSSLDHLGFRINYHYDHAGRIDLLTDDTGSEMVRYEYDTVGRMSKKIVESGAYTIYEYDAAGRISKLQNLDPLDDLISGFEYGYDQRGRRVFMEAHYGTWTYDYDEIDQITRAVLDSTDSQIQSMDISYVYDAMGNRIETVTGGTTEEYMVNRLNQYVSAGDRNYTYDLDGNLIREEGPGGEVIYNYDDENRLVGVTRGSDVWQYEYDGLDNRAVEIHNGEITHNIIDPSGLGNIVGTYDETGGLISGYVHGPDLVGFYTDIGDIHHYTFDVTGNVHEVMGSDGELLNSYVFEPFGNPIHVQETVSNPFRFVGEKGVRADPTGLIHMRARHYDPLTGRFLSTDPIGILGDDLNLYRYVHNSPTNYVDPTGLWIPWNDILDPKGFVPWSEIGGETMGKGGQAVGAGIDIYSGGSTAIAGFTLLATATGGLPFLLAGGLIVWGSHTILKSVFTLVFIASDPNQKLGPSGYGPENHIKEGSTFSYHVDFENLEDATAPAQIVTVRDPLSEHLDWSTFELTQIGFGDVIIPLEKGTRYLEEVVNYRFEDDEYDMDIEVHIDAGIDMDAGEVYVNFYSIDPVTGILPTVETGFLPPEDGTGRGLGFFSYLIKPKDDLPGGTAIRNIATIQFDFGLSIDTNQIDPMDKTKGTDPDMEALVTIDANPPASTMDDLPGAVPPPFEVSWTGQDEEGGSGIAAYDIFVREKDDPWSLWLEKTNMTSAVFKGDVGSTYSFYSVAIDNVGHHEEKQALAEAITTVNALIGPTANAGPDQSVEEGTTVTFIGSASTDDMGIANYTWTLDDGTGEITLFGTGPKHTFVLSGVYTVTLNVTNSGGIWDTDTMIVTVDPVKEEEKGESSPMFILVIVIALIILVLIFVCILVIYIFTRSKKDSHYEE